MRFSWFTVLLGLLSNHGQEGVSSINGVTVFATMLEIADHGYLHGNLFVRYSI